MVSTRLDLLDYLRIALGLWCCNWLGLAYLSRLLMHSTDLSYRDLGVTGVLGGILAWISDEIMVVYVTLVFMLLGLFVSFLRKANHWLWLKINLFTEKVGGGLMLFMVYFFLVTPIGWFFRLSKKRLNSNATWRDSDSTFSKEDLHKTW